MIGKIFCKREDDEEPVLVGRMVFDEGEIQSHAVLVGISNFALHEAETGAGYFISIDGSDEAHLWKILGATRLPLKGMDDGQDHYKFRLAMDALPSAGLD